ncbi:hypothetical protein GCM10010909_30230 [Acidocella aquatica]|uniref:Lipoprotein n=1 Tax=Acidocella aquatica TaxID=1922313 RepID=A0ABQ6A9C8_9PROT|nr:hypothetical protein [Acidocella aquatica]GLR68342.1 hypothetical protein GCM10010909_30230 [Acidocella aquatica]
MKQFTTPLLSLAMLAALAGCASTPASSTPAAPPAPKPVAQQYCPQVAVLAQTQNLTTFLPGRSDVGAQVTTARITGVAGSCLLKVKKNLLEVKFQAGFSASNGPANQGAPITLPYFVAITQGDTIVQENYYSIVLKFNGNASIAQATSKPLAVELPNTPDSAQTQILVGFEMTPEQLSYAAAHPATAP